MATVEITTENFESIIEGNSLVVLDFWASWCGPCKRFGPIFEAVSEKHDDIVFGKVNTEEQREIQAAFGIQSIPTTVFFRDQIALHLQPGLLPPEGLEDLIEQVRGIDMDALRKEIAERQAQAATEQ